MSEEKRDSHISNKQELHAKKSTTSEPFEIRTHYSESDLSRIDGQNSAISQDSAMDYCSMSETDTLEGQNKFDESSERSPTPLFEDCSNDTPLCSSDRLSNLNLSINETIHEKQKANFPNSPKSPLKRKASTYSLESKSDCKDLSGRLLSSSSSENIQLSKHEESPVKRSRIQTDYIACSVPSKEDDDLVFKVPGIPPKRSKSLSPMKAKRMIVEHRRSASECTEIHRYKGYSRRKPEKLENDKPKSTIPPLKRKVLELDSEATCQSRERFTSNRRLSSNNIPSENIPLQEQEESPAKKIRTQSDSQLCSTASEKIDDDSAFKVPSIPPRRYKSLSPMKAKCLIVERRRSTSECFDMRRYRQYPCEILERVEEKSPYPNSSSKRKVLDLGLESTSETKEFCSSNRKLTSSESTQLSEQEEFHKKVIKFRLDSQAGTESLGKVDEEAVFKIPAVPPRRYKSLSPMKAKRMIVEHRRSASENPEMHRYRHSRRICPEVLSNRRFRRNPEVYRHRRKLKGSLEVDKCSRSTDKRSKYRHLQSERRDSKLSKSVGKSVGVPPIIQPPDSQFLTPNLESALLSQNMLQDNNPIPSRDVVTQTSINSLEEQSLKQAEVTLSASEKSAEKCQQEASNSGTIAISYDQQALKEIEDSPLRDKREEILCQEQEITSRTQDPNVESEEKSETEKR